ncbi:MAG: Calx-beta domain-containing protein, partial [Planctomycetota bacterium]
MHRKLTFSAVFFLLLGPAGAVSAADLYVPQGETLTISTSETYGRIDVDGTLVIESSASVVATGASGKSGVRGCCAEIIINGGSLDINSRFDTDGDGEPGAKITMNGGFFEADDLKLPDNQGPVTITLNAGVFHAVSHQPYLNRNFKVIIGDGLYRVDGDVEGQEDADPRTWLTYNPPALLPAEGYTVDDIIIEYVAAGGYTEVRVDATPRVQFETASSAAFETVSPATLAVSLRNPEQGVTYTVHYEATGGTAAGGGTDYSLEPNTLTFSPGETSKTINIDIVNDAVDENDETIVVTLSNPTGAGLNLGAITEHTYTILDPRPRVSFNEPSSRGREDVSPVGIPVSLSWATDSTVAVDYAVTGGTATNGVDYFVSDPGTLVFDPGQTSKTIDVVVIEDEEQEEYESIELTLSGLSGYVRPGSNMQHTYTIVENRFPSFADGRTIALWLFDEADYPHTTLTDAGE